MLQLFDTYITYYFGGFTFMLTTKGFQDISQFNDKQSLGIGLEGNMLVQRVQTKTRI